MSAASSSDVAALLASARAWKAEQSAEEQADVAAIELAIIRAASDGHHEYLMSRIDEGGSRINLDAAPGFDGNTALHWAVEKGHLECVRILCSRGATVDSRERWQSWTPLMVAASKDRRREAEVLLAAGAAVNAEAKGRTAIDLAATPEMKAILLPEEAISIIESAAKSAKRAPRPSRFEKLHEEFEALSERAEGVLSDEDWQAVAPGFPMSWIIDRGDVKIMQVMVCELRQRLCEKDETFRPHGHQLRSRRRAP